MGWVGMDGWGSGEEERKKRKKVNIVAEFILD